MEKTVPYIYWRRIPFGDTDAAAIVYTPRFADYCMEAAEHWFRDYIGFDWFRMNTEFGRGTPVVHMEMDFQAPLAGSDRLDVAVRVIKLGRSTVTLGFEGIRVRDREPRTTAFTATYIYCFTEADQGSVAIPDQYRQLIEAYAGLSETAEPAPTSVEHR